MYRKGLIIMPQSDSSMLSMLAELGVHTVEDLYEMLDAFTDITDSLTVGELTESYAMEEEKAAVVVNKTTLFIGKVHDRLADYQ